MEKEDVALLAQLLTVIREAMSGLEKAENAGDVAKVNGAKKEILRIQKQIDGLL
tara:strand:+ start:362 stop:523 length:162 start_codon:yes stop_codon:yes gene_type:complete